MRRLVIALLITCTGLLAVPPVAGAGTFQPLSVSLASPVEPLTFDLQVLTANCGLGTFSVVSVTANGAPVEPVSVTQDPSLPSAATMVLPSDTPPGTLIVVVTCMEGQTPITVTGTEEWAAVAVTKVVEGTPPPGATFTVHADCVDTIIVTGSGFGDAGTSELPDDFTADLSYGAEGGLAYIYSDHAADCTLTEPESGGASSVTFDPEVVVINDPDLFEATVTNTFAAAAPIVVEPTFTG